jgi:hypothetical protein
MNKKEDLENIIREVKEGGRVIAKVNYPHLTLMSLKLETSQPVIAN